MSMPWGHHVKFCQNSPDPIFVEMAFWVGDFFIGTRDADEFCKIIFLSSHDIESTS